MKNYLISALMSVCLSLPAVAQQEDPKDDPTTDDPWISRMDIETRFGWGMTNIDGHSIGEATGFRGQFINLRLDGKVYKNFTYSWRQRLNSYSSNSFWDATDWLEVKYSYRNKLTIAGGKQVVALGGFEYDRAPIDIYHWGEFCQHFDCYQMGLSASYRLSQNDNIMFQFCTSPFRRTHHPKYLQEATQENPEPLREKDNNHRYAFSLLWSGNHGCYNSLFSVNAFQNCDGRWMNYLALGNKVDFCRQVYLECDFVNRASSGQAFFFKDCSVCSELNYLPHPAVKIHAKYTFDVNHTGTDADVYVVDGTELHSAGGGVEYQPIKKYPRLLRLFAAAYYTWGTGTNVVNDGHTDKQLNINVGFKADIDILNAVKHLIKKTHKKEIRESESISI